MNLKALLKRYTVDQLREAIRLRGHLGRVDALEAKKAALLRQVAKIDRKLSKLTGNGSVSDPEPKRKRRRFSKATRLKMAASQRARWAKAKRSASATATT